MELKLNHTWHSHTEGNDGYEPCLACQDEAQARLTLKQVYDLLRTVRYHTEFCTDRQSFEAVLEQLRQEAEK